MDSQKCREVLKSLKTVPLVEEVLWRGEKDGSLLRALDFALTVLDEWEKGNEYKTFSEMRASIASLESDLARMKGFMEKIRDEHNSDLWQELHAIKNIAKQALRLGE